MLRRLILLGVVLVFCTGGAIYSLFQLNNVSVMSVENTHVATVFIHGYRGNDRSLHGMIRRFDEKYHVGTDALTIQVSNAGELSVSGQFDKNSRNPLVNIVFKNSHATIAQQALWTKKVMRFLKAEYGIKQFNAVGHSMGGGAWVAYLASDKKNKDYPIVKKIVFLAVPFYPEEYINGTAAINLKNANLIHMKFAKKMVQKLPRHIDILMIGGNLNDGTRSDGEVQIDSILYGEKLFKDQHIETHILKGSDASHTNLHELPEVDRYVTQFLFTNHS